MAPLIKVDQITICRYMMSIRTPFKYKDTNKLKINRWRKVYYANSNQEKVEVAILILD